MWEYASLAEEFLTDLPISFSSFFSQGVSLFVFFSRLFAMNSPLSSSGSRASARGGRFQILEERALRGTRAIARIFGFLSSGENIRNNLCHV